MGLQMLCLYFASASFALSHCALGSLWVPETIGLMDNLETRGYRTPFYPGIWWLLHFLTTMVLMVQQWKDHILSSHLCLSLINQVPWVLTQRTLVPKHSHCPWSLGSSPYSWTNSGSEALEGECHCRHTGKHEHEWRNARSNKIPF
jgi:hypothetical protein